MFVTVYVGCIECDVPTEVIGIYATEDEAKAAADKITKGVEEGGESWDRFLGGEGYAGVFGPFHLECPRP